MTRKSIKIHGDKWGIRYVAPRSKFLDKGKSSAVTEFDKHIIYMAKELCQDRHDFVLYHELCHILLDHTGLSNKVRSDTEDAICDAFAAFIKEYFSLKG